MPPKGSGRGRGNKRRSAPSQRTSSKRARGLHPDEVEESDTPRSLRSYNQSPTRRITAPAETDADDSVDQVDLTEDSNEQKSDSLDEEEVTADVPEEKYPADGVDGDGPGADAQMRADDNPGPPTQLAGTAPAVPKAGQSTTVMSSKDAEKLLLGSGVVKNMLDELRQLRAEAKEDRQYIKDLTGLVISLRDRTVPHSHQLLSDSTSSSATATSTERRSSSTGESPSTSSVFPTSSAASSSSSVASTSSSTTASSKADVEIRRALRDIKEWEPSISPDAERLDSWLNRFELIVTTSDGGEQHMLKFIGQRLKGIAFHWYAHDWRTAAARIQPHPSWADFKKAIKDHFQPTQSLTVITSELEKCMKTTKEKYPDHLTRFQQILTTAPADDPLPDMLVAQIYLRCLDPNVAYAVRNSHFGTAINSKKPPTLAQLCQCAVDCAQSLHELHTHSSAPSPAPGRASSGAAVHHVSTQTSPAMATSTASSSSSASRSFVGPGVSPNYKGKNPDPTYQHRGPKQQQGGHGSSATPPPQQTPPLPNLSPLMRSTGSTGPRVCYNCQQPGHYKKDCPLPKAQGGQVKRETGQRPPSQ